MLTFVTRLTLKLLLVSFLGATLVLVGWGAQAVANGRLQVIGNICLLDPELQILPSTARTLLGRVTITNSDGDVVDSEENVTVTRAGQCLVQFDLQLGVGSLTDLISGEELQVILEVCGEIIGNSGNVRVTKGTSCLFNDPAVVIVDEPLDTLIDAQLAAIIAEFGPPGPPGEPGPSGTAVLAGQACPAGQVVIGFDAEANIICAPGGSPQPGCGSGFIDTGEACDDGATVEGDGCSASCAVEAGYNCTGQPSICSEICGDGLSVGAEECDGSGESDTCDDDCTFAACGDGNLNETALEQCDDGNTSNGDGCSDTCQIETAPTQACCIFTLSGCQDLEPLECSLSGGSPLGPGTQCITSTCPF